MKSREWWRWYKTLQARTYLPYSTFNTKDAQERHTSQTSPNTSAVHFKPTHLSCFGKDQWHFILWTAIINRQRLEAYLKEGVLHFLFGCTHMHLHTYTHAYTCSHTHTHVHTHTCTHTRADTHAHTDTYAHTHTRTHAICHIKLPILYLYQNSCMIMDFVRN